MPPADSPTACHVGALPGRLRQPVRVAHDRDDLTVPVADGKRLSAALPAAGLMLTSWLGPCCTVQNLAMPGRGGARMAHCTMTQTAQVCPLG